MFKTINWFFEENEYIIHLQMLNYTIYQLNFFLGLLMLFWYYEQFNLRGYIQ